MGRNYKIAKIKKTEQWMGDFETEVCRLAPQYSGKIEWDSAKYHHACGMNPLDAAEVYVKSRSIYP
jgi:hypothetical protein